MSTRTLFIGDVHGCYDELMALLEKVEIHDDDTLYFVGDLINKGPKSLEVVEFVRNRPNTFSVMGNHEFFSLKKEYISYEENNHLKWIENRYEQTYELRTKLNDMGYTDWILSFPIYIEREDFILVHGGFHPKYGKDTPAEIATMIRVIEGKPWYESYTGEKLVIYGHWATAGLRVTKNTIGLDTGCSFGGHLTAYCLETAEFWQVRANKVYAVPANWKILPTSISSKD
ncbi:MAG: metallophosphoesterase family protein [Candidatus Altimarinota bacterium]